MDQFSRSWQNLLDHPCWTSLTTSYWRVELSTNFLGRDFPKPWRVSWLKLGWLKTTKLPVASCFFFSKLFLYRLLLMNSQIFIKSHSTYLRLVTFYISWHMSTHVNTCRQPTNGLGLDIFGLLGGSSPGLVSGKWPPIYKPWMVIWKGNNPYIFAWSSFWYVFWKFALWESRSDARGLPITMVINHLQVLGWSSKWYGPPWGMSPWDSCPSCCRGFPARF